MTGRRSHGRLLALNGVVHQGTDQVVILNEMIHEARVIPLDDRTHVDSGIRQWRGDSKGR